MQRTAKRVFNEPALETWFNRLDTDWESQFRKAVMERGRELYRDSVIRSLEMSETDVVIQGRIGEVAYYAVVECDSGKLAIRGSSDDKQLSESLAIAGLYEIEELLVEEVTDVIPDAAPPEVTVVTSEADRANTAKTSSTGEINGSFAKAAPKKPTDPKHTDPAIRRLEVDFVLSRKGLSFEAFWKNGSHKRAPAFGPKAAPNSLLANREREQLIRLANKARKAGFQMQTGSNRFRLDPIDSAPTFIRSALPQWRRHFTVNAPETLGLLTRGLRDVDVRARINATHDGLQLEWDLTVFGQRLDDADVALLLRSEGQPQFINGRGLLRIGSECADAIHDWQEAMALADNGHLPRYLLFSLFHQEAFPVDIAEPLAQWQAQLKTPAQQSGLPECLRDYQRHGVAWLWHLCDCDCHGLLADDMGLGKTLQILSLLRTRQLTAQPSLIVCPASVIPVWESELETFFPGTSCAVLGRDGDFSQADEASVWLASYTQLRRYHDQLSEVGFGYAVLDEAQYIKNPDAKVTQACLSIRARHRIALSGTPMENRQTDLWTLFRFLMPGLLGGRERFEQLVRDDAEKAVEKLKRQTAPFLLRRTKAHVLPELPPRVENVLVCPMTEVQSKEYRRLATEGMQRFDGQSFKKLDNRERMGLLALLTRLRQTCCDPGLLPWMQTPAEASGKLNVLAERLTEIIGAGHRVVIFSQFTSLLDRAQGFLSQQLPETLTYRLDGRTRDRHTPVKAFQESDEAGVFFVSLKAGGTGLTLHAADYVFLLDPWWNPAVERQAMDRVHRIGQTNTVFIYRLVTEGTLEARIERLKQSKQHLFESVVGTGGGATDFTSYFSSLRELVDELPERH